MLWHHTHRLLYLPAVLPQNLPSKNGNQGLICFFCSGGAAELPSMVTVTGNSILPHRCLFKIWYGICPIMCQQCSHRTHRKCFSISRCVTNPSWQYSACSLPTTSIPNQPMMAMTDNTHAPTVLPPTTNINCLLTPSPSHQPTSTIVHDPAANTNPVPPYITTRNTQYATKR